MENDTYRILARENEAQIREKGSRFIARAIPVKSSSDAVQYLEQLKKREYDATHHCTAFRIGRDASEVRFNDDGEPSGTAGAPILRQIESAELTDTLVVVTRYYGGTKLGTGGLIRAYGAAAEAVLSTAVTEIVTRRIRFLLTFEYDDTSPAMHAIQQFDTIVAASRYGEKTFIEVDVRLSEAEQFERSFVDGLGGRGTVERIS
jgi:uncharacterized YigZ family protein